jgi:hypothetical protein
LSSLCHDHAVELAFGDQALCGILDPFREGRQAERSEAADRARREAEAKRKAAAEAAKKKADE